MHEITLAQAIWRQVSEEMRRHGARGLRAVDVAVGAFSGADPESLQFALQLAAEGSEWAGADVRVRTEPLALRCRACAAAYETTGTDLACPACGSADAEVTGGRDVRLQSLEVETADA